MERERERGKGKRGEQMRQYLVSEGGGGSRFPEWSGCGTPLKLSDQNDGTIPMILEQMLLVTGNRNQEEKETRSKCISIKKIRRIDHQE